MSGTVVWVAEAAGSPGINKLVSVGLPSVMLVIIVVMVPRRITGLVAVPPKLNAGCNPQLVPFPTTAMDAPVIVPDGHWPAGPVAPVAP